MQRSRPLIAFVVICLSIFVIVALLRTLIYQSPSPPDQRENPLEKGWLCAGIGDLSGGGSVSSCCRGILGWLNGCCLAPRQLEPMNKDLLLFTVYPASPKLYWRIFTADEYDGLSWRRSTYESIVDEFTPEPQTCDHLFTVDLNTTPTRISLPVPPPPSPPQLSGLNLVPPSENLTRLSDEMAGVYGIEIPIHSSRTNVHYCASWNHVEIDASSISMEDVPDEINSIYLQLPDDLPSQVHELARGLENSSLTPYDQILADMHYLMTNFTYDFDFSEGRTSRIIEDDWVLSYLNWRKGICVDAATALAVILRCQGIPARISMGFAPGETSANKTLYFSKNAHAETEAYLPPYKWVRFDATPGAECLEHCNPQDYPASRPQTPDTDGDGLCDGDEVSIGTDPLSPDVDERIPTLTYITHVPVEFVLRQEPFQIIGTVTTLTDEPVGDMPVEIHVRESKESEGILCGEGVSQQDGDFQIQCVVPYDFEVGEYCVVACSTGTAVYAPSDSDPTIKIGAETYINLTLQLQEPILLNETIGILGRLVDDNRTSLCNVTVDLKIGADKVAELITDENGSFNTTYRLRSPGIFEVETVFPGSEYFLPSSNSTSVEVHVPEVWTDIEHLIRGEENEISGTLLGGEDGAAGREIAIYLDDDSPSLVKTGEAGFFAQKYTVNLHHSLDNNHTLTFAICGTGRRISVPIRIVARTRLEMSAPGEVAQASSFTFTAFLFDDTDSPLADEEIAWEETLQTTQRDGKVEFSKYAQLWLWFRDMNLTCSFEGSDKYLPSHSSKMVVSCPNFFLLIFPPAVVASAVSGYFVYRRRRRRSGLSEPEDSGTEEPASKKHVYSVSEKSPLVLSFPDIQPPFPNVWGAGENLRIRCSLGKAFGDKIEGGKVSFLIDDDLVGEGRLSTRKDAVMSENFAEKGTYMISARALDDSGSSLRTDVDLRIVDYREEIIALYKIFLQRLHSLNVEVEDDITARELQSRLASHELLDKNQVENLVSCFEEADYSNHPVGRRHYERMYLSFEGLKGAQ